MRPNKIHYEVLLEHYTYDCDEFRIWTYNDSLKAYKKYSSLREWYKKLDEAQKSEICIKLKVCDRTITESVLLCDVVHATGFNVMDGYILNGNEWERIEGKYFPEELPQIE